MFKILISYAKKFQLPERVNISRICHRENHTLLSKKPLCERVLSYGGKGFSLVEMLMALLVASLLLAALAPVMTQKIHDIVDFGGDRGNSTKHRTVYLTEPGDGEWILPDGIRTFDVTVVGGGGGGGAAGTYGCVVFTTEAGAYLGEDAEYCEIRRGNGDMSFTIPQGVDEIYVSMVSGAGGGGGASAKWARKIFNETENWAVPPILLGDRIGVVMTGAGGGGGGSDQGGGGGGSAGAANFGLYDIAQNKTNIQVDVGKGGGGGHYWNSPGKGGTGWKNGGDGVAGTGGGGGGGSSSFDNGAMSAFGGGGGAGQCISGSGWYYPATFGDIWKTYFNTGGDGKNGGYCGPEEGYNGYGGLSGGAGGDGGAANNSPRGKAGQDGTVGENGTAKGSARGGGGGGSSNSYGAGKGGHGQDYDMYSGSADVGGGAGGGGGGSNWSGGTSAPTACGAPRGQHGTAIAKAGVGAGGAGASCGWNAGGVTRGGDGGDGRIDVRYLLNLYGGSGALSGKVVPRSRVALTNSMNAGKTLIITPGKGGAGGDRVILINTEAPADANLPHNIRTMNKSGVINTSDTTLSNANGKPGSPSTIKFNGTLIASTAGGACGAKYRNTSSYTYDCGGASSDGTSAINGTPISMVGGWHGHQGHTCNSSVNPLAGDNEKGGASTVLVWDSTDICGMTGGIAGTGTQFSKRNGADGTTGLGGSGAYYGGFGGKGGDGYIKIEWGIPRNIDKTAPLRYSGGGGSAGETVIKRVTLPPIVNKVSYSIGNGGIGGRYGSATGANGANGADTVFGAPNRGDGFEQIKAKGGQGGKSASVTSTYDANSIITSLAGNFGAGGTAQCYKASNCKDSMNGTAGTDNAGGKGGTSNTGIGGAGGTGDNQAGSDGTMFNGYSGGGAGGGGGVSVYGAFASAGGGKGGGGYIKIEYID